jgi:hypothetical protein
MSSDVSRNLLFAVVSVQLGFISREQLVAAVGVWLLDKTKSIERILQEQSALRSSDIELLRPLVERHIDNHDGDAERSLAAISSIDDIQSALHSLGDEQIDATISVVGTAPKEAASTPDFDPVSELKPNLNRVLTERF